MDIRQYRLRWDWGTDGLDVAHVMDASEGLRISGRHGNYLYWVATGHNGAAKFVEITGKRGDESVKRITLKREDDGWREDGDAIVAGSAGVLDVDVGCTVVTNTCAIRRLALAPGQVREIDVLMIPVPELEPRVVRQRYSRMPQGFLYENLENGFSVLLEVDSEGWVVNYPGLCKRVEA